MVETVKNVGGGHMVDALKITRNIVFIGKS